MALKIGIVGLPNVGKSTLFNALTKTQAAQAANYPFCTIDPNVGVVEVPDERLDMLAVVNNSVKKLPATIEFVDIAGLVKGANSGEGLGNKFLAHIRECDAIAHVVRDFDDPNIIHVHGEINPLNDREVIESELILADLQTLEKRILKATADAKSGNAEKKKYLGLLISIRDRMEQGNLASTLDISDDDRVEIRDLHLLTIKPHIYVVNMPEESLRGFDREEYAKKLGNIDVNKVIPISAKMEQELVDFSDEEVAEILNDFNLKETGLNSLIRNAYETLGLITYFTSGPTETRAWTIKKGISAPQAAGVIHTDFEKGFIKAEVIKWKNLVDAGGEIKAKEKGFMRMEGKDYIVEDGDVMLFKFNV
ncbi:redox-regulated ATPase YchF [Candidatus Peregrinibacteria bacterium HGW-Peregrinibacteria-1]|jgi:hypothetical protein|nr:MAG: redox-regulated ATPase YchF [Candidatus Peregrinibacteria bacterium HGW-Peregrinibacteria-1]